MMGEITYEHVPLTIVNIIPHRLQRYNTCGDWPPPLSGIQHFFISRMSKRGYEAALFVHEFVEEEWSAENHVTAEMVDGWDTGEGKDMDDPGSDPRCPYYRGHILGLEAERFVIEKVFGLKWDEYEEELDRIWQEREDATA